MKNTKTILALLVGVIACSMTMISPKSAEAIVVYDPTNHIQNILQALRELKSNLNEALMIRNQVKSLANEFENLKKIDFSIIDDYSNQMNDLFEVSGSINGLMQDFNSLQSEFERLYPDFESQTGIDAKDLSKQASEWLKMSRETILGASKTGSKVLENLPRSQNELEELLAHSKGSAGILQAAQAGNEISATVAANLQSLNTQLATYTQAHLSYMMQQQSAQAAVEARSREVMQGWGERKTNTKVPLPGL